MAHILTEILRPAPPFEIGAGGAYSTITSLPSDPAPVSEGDDRIHSSVGSLRASAIRRGRELYPALATPGVRYVPFTRALYPAKSTGRDVIAVQRALQKQGVRKNNPSGWFGPLMKKQVQTFQHSKGIQATGSYGQATHEALLPFFDNYGAWLMQQALSAQRAHAMRHLIVATALFGVSVRDSIHYSQGSLRMDGVSLKLKPPKYPTETDCSGYATWCYWVALAPDPCGPGPKGFNYNLADLHYTGTIAEGGTRVSTAMPGDLNLYGEGPTYEHVTIAIDSERCVSNGSEPGPLILPIHYRDDFAETRSYIERA